MPLILNAAGEEMYIYLSTKKASLVMSVMYPPLP